VEKNIGNDFSFGQYKLFVDIRRLFWENCHQTKVGWLKSTNLQLSLSYIFVSFRKRGRHYCTLRQQPVLDFCRHQ